MFRCINCGFKFIHPEYKKKPLPIGGFWAIDPQALNIPVCPKCKSDALETVKQKE